MKLIRSKLECDKIRLFIAGAQKAGTTSLKHYLGEHPEVLTHEQKEFAYFYDNDEYSEGQPNAFRKYFGRHYSDKILIAKNAGLYVRESALQRLHQHNPDCIIVLLLRNPVERAYSAYQMEKNYGNYTGSFGDVKSLIDSAAISDWRYEFIIKMGMYSEYLQLIYKYFPKENVLLYRFEDLMNCPGKITSTLFQRMGVKSTFEPDFSVKHNVTRKMRSEGYAKILMKLLRNSNPLKRVARKIIPTGQDYKIGELLRNVNKSSDTPESISFEMRNVLTNFYAPYNDQLSELTGVDFSVWNKLST
jgi:hypothetical protein